MLVLGSQVVDLMGQLVDYSFAEQRSQEEILHHVECGRLVEATLVIVPLAKDIFGPTRRRHRQWFG